MAQSGPVLATVAALWLAVPLCLANPELAEAAGKPPTKADAAAKDAKDAKTAAEKAASGVQDVLKALQDKAGTNSDGEDQIVVTKQRLSILDERYQESVEFLTFERRISLASGRIDRNFNLMLKPILASHFGRNFTDEELEGAKTVVVDGVASKAAKVPAYQYIHDYLEDFYLGNQLMLRPSGANVFQSGLLSESKRTLNLPDGSTSARSPLLGDAIYGFGTFGYHHHQGPVSLSAEVSVGLGVDTSLDPQGHIDGVHLRPLLMPGLSLESHFADSINFSVLSFNLLFEPAGAPLYFAGPSGWMLTLAGGPIFSF